MKIWHQSMADFTKLQTYGDALRAHSIKVCAPGTEVVVKGLAPKNYLCPESEVSDRDDAEFISTSGLLGSPYIYHIGFQQIMENAQQAEREGFDAFVIGSFSEPFLKEIRSAVQIPVASVGESNFLLACSYGKFQAHIANVPTVGRLVSDHVHEYRLDGRVSGSYSLGQDMDEIYMQHHWHDPSDIIGRFVALAERAIIEGADVIVPTEGVLSELLYLNGVHSVGKAPVFDSFGMAWKYAELMVELRRKMDLSVGREWEYRRPGGKVMARARRIHGLTA